MLGFPGSNHEWSSGGCGMRSTKSAAEPIDVASDTLDQDRSIINTSTTRTVRQPVPLQWRCLGKRFEQVEETYAAANGSSQFADNPAKYDLPDSVVGFLAGELGETSRRAAGRSPFLARRSLSERSAPHTPGSPSRLPVQDLYRFHRLRPDSERLGTPSYPPSRPG